MPEAARPPDAEMEDLLAFLSGAGVRPPARILDVPCGIGRRAYRLAEQGYRVTAVDANDVAITALRRRAPKRAQGRLECRPAPRDALPGLPPADTYDAILCLDHAVGRGPRDADVAFLARLCGHVAPGGLLLLDLLHRDFFAARPRPFAYHVIGGVEQHEFRAFDPISGVLDLTWRFYRREGKDLRFEGSSSARIRLMAPHEAEGLLAEAGWHVEAWHGGWKNEAVSADRRKIVLVARAAAELNSVPAFVARAPGETPDPPRSPGKGT